MNKQISCLIINVYLLVRESPFLVKEMFTERERDEYKHNNKKNAASYDSCSFWSKNDLNTCH